MLSAREIAVLIAMCVVWGLHFIVIKTAVGELPPMFYAAVRMTLVAVLMAPFLRWRPGRMAPVIAGGFCLGALNYALMFSGIKHATASASAIAIELYVPFATILSIIFLGDKLGWRRGVGIVIAFAGVAVIAISQRTDWGNATNTPLGVGLVAAGAFSEAVGAIMVKRAVGFKPHQLLAWFGVIGAVGLWVMTAVFESGQSEAWRAADKPLIVSAVIFSALGASIFGHSAYYWLLQRLPVSVVAPSVLLTTVIAVTSSILILGDPFGWPLVVGGLLTLSGVGTVLLRSAAKQDKSVVLSEPPG